MSNKIICLDSKKGLVYGNGDAIPVDALQSFIALAQCQLRIAQGLEELANWSKAFQRTEIQLEGRQPPLRAGGVTWVGPHHD